MTLKEWTELFGDNLNDLMEEKHITQRELARASGLSIGAINSYIHGQSPPGIKAVINICYALDIDMAELLDFGDVID